MTPIEIENKIQQYKSNKITKEDFFIFLMSLYVYEPSRKGNGSGYFKYKILNIRNSYNNNFVITTNKKSYIITIKDTITSLHTNIFFDRISLFGYLKNINLSKNVQKQFQFEYDTLSKKYPEYFI